MNESPGVLALLSLFAREILHRVRVRGVRVVQLYVPCTAFVEFGISNKLPVSAAVTSDSIPADNLTDIHHIYDIIHKIALRGPWNHT